MLKKVNQRDPVIIVPIAEIFLDIFQSNNRDSNEGLGFLDRVKCHKIAKLADTTF